MNKSIILGISLTMLLSAGVVMAGDQKSTEANDTVIFHSMTSLPSDFTPMTTEALEATEGKGNFCGAFCGTWQSQSARVNQHNHSVLSLLSLQNNNALVLQANTN